MNLIINFSHFVSLLKGRCWPQILKLLHTESENRTLDY